MGIILPNTLFVFSLPGPQKNISVERIRILFHYSISAAALFLVYSSSPVNISWINKIAG